MGDPYRSVGGWLYAFLTHSLTLVAFGGALGSCVRYAVTTWIGAPLWARGFPIATFVINVSGSFVLGVAAAVIGKKLPPAYGYWYLLVGTGFCGGYTTFSTFSWETYQLVELRSWWLALGNALGSVAAGLIGVVLGVALVNTLFRSGPLP